jgi:hypothetical protein
MPILLKIANLYVQLLVNPLLVFNIFNNCSFFFKSYVCFQTGIQRSTPVWPPEAEGEGSGLIDGFITDYSGIFKNADLTVSEDVGIKLGTVAAL